MFSFISKLISIYFYLFPLPSCPSVPTFPSMVTPSLFTFNKHNFNITIYMFFCENIFFSFFSVVSQNKIGYLDQGLLVRDASKLRKHYFSAKRWRIDLLSMLPTDLAYIWWPPSSCNASVPCPVIVRLNRLLRLPRMWEWFDRTETATGYPNAFRICKVCFFFCRVFLV